MDTRSKKRKRENLPPSSLQAANPVWYNIAQQLPNDFEGYKTLLGMRAANPAFYRFLRDNPAQAKEMESKFFEKKERSPAIFGHKRFVDIAIVAKKSSKYSNGGTGVHRLLHDAPYHVSEHPFNAENPTDLEVSTKTGKREYRTEIIKLDPDADNMFDNALRVIDADHIKDNHTTAVMRELQGM